MRLSYWYGCLALAGLTVAAHLLACRHAWPTVLLSLLISAIVLYNLRRTGVSADPGRAAALALAPGGRWEDEAPAGHRSKTVIVLVLLGGLCVMLTLASGWLAWRAQATGAQGGTGIPLETRP